MLVKSLSDLFSNSNNNNFWIESEDLFNNCSDISGNKLENNCRILSTNSSISLDKLLICEAILFTSKPSVVDSKVSTQSSKPLICEAKLSSSFVSVVAFVKLLIFVAKLSESL